MAADLTLEAARSIAAALQTIGHPYNQAAINATAMDLVRWCKGVILNGRFIGPEEQAIALVNEARETWDQWPEQGGTKQLRNLFNEMFRDPSAGTTPTATYELRREPSCSTCSDTGWEIVTRNGIEGAQPCSACGAARKPEASVCPKCSGKETILIEGDRPELSRRVPCSCVPPERRGKGLQVIQGLLREAS